MAKTIVSPRTGDYEAVRSAMIDTNETYEAEALNELVLELHSVSNYQPLTLEQDTVWGTAIAIPQIARSSKWDSTFLMLAFRVYVNYILCIALVLGILTYIGEETHIMNPLGEQMHLCDFGANLASCPDGDQCTGPGGTKYSPEGLYGYDEWNMHRYVKKALLATFPDKEHLINKHVPVGEYGLENYWCRLTTIVLFVMSMLPELAACLNYIRFFWEIPTNSESWLKYSKSETASDEKRDPWEQLTFQVSGMPLHWKIFHFVVLVLPRVLICHFVLREGMQLLMETSGITDAVLSSCAMSFVTDIGGMIFRCLAPRPVAAIMPRLKQPPPVPQDKTNPTKWLLIIPGKIVALLVVLSIYLFDYYHEHCAVSPVDGSWVSKDVYLPESSSFTFLNMLLHNQKYEEKAFWTMPQP